MAFTFTPHHPHRHLQGQSASPVQKHLHKVGPIRPEGGGGRGKLSGLLLVLFLFCNFRQSRPQPPVDLFCSQTNEWANLNPWR